MNKELINGVIDATIDFVGACANDVCANAENEYTVFEGALKADSEGNLKVYSKSGDLVSQTPVRKILTNLKGLGHNLVDLFEADEKERAKKAEEEAAAQAQADKAANEEIENKINDLQSEISSLKLQKRSVRYVKRF